MLLENLRYPEVEEYLDTGNLILVPVGSVEQHSPWGLLGTDFITAEHLARKAGERLDVMVAPTICYGVSPHHLGFAGTVSLAPQTLVAVVCDIARSLAAHGFDRIVFVNGHGGNIAPIQVAMATLKMEGMTAMLRLLSWYTLPGVAELCNELYDGQDGSHATASEVAVTMDSRPHAFAAARLPAPVPVECPPSDWPLSAEQFRATFPDGRMGSAPWLASTEAGRQLCEAAVAGLVKELSADLAA